jgi:hypothetical protein
VSENSISLSSSRLRTKQSPIHLSIMAGNNYAVISFRKGFAKSELDAALSSSGGPNSKAVIVERRNIRVIQELIYQFRSVMIQLGRAIPSKNARLKSLFAKGHKLIVDTRIVMDKFQAKQHQVPITCSCECAGPSTSSMQMIFDLEDDSDIEVDLDIEEEGYL